MTASGTQYTISGHGYTATVCEVGATLRTLSRDGRDLVVPFAAEELRPLCRGAVLAPWPNRIADGRYGFDGSLQQLPLTEPSRGNAIHGLVSWERFSLVSQGADVVELRHLLVPQTGYPWELAITVTYRLAADGLHWWVRAENVGDGTAPYGVAPHPYLRAGDSPLDSWTLHVPAADVLEVTTDRLLPTGRTGVGGTRLDFRTPRPIGATEIDHAYTALLPRGDGAGPDASPDAGPDAGPGGPSGADDANPVEVQVLDADGVSGVSCRWDAAVSPWVQVHTADRPEAHNHRVGLAVEPMTCPPDAFNSGVDLVRLAPGAAHEAHWVIGAIG